MSARVAAFESDNINLLQCLDDIYGDDYETLLSMLPVSAVPLLPCDVFVSMRGKYLYQFQCLRQQRAQKGLALLQVWSTGRRKPDRVTSPE